MTLTSQNPIVVTILALLLGFVVGAFIIIFTTATILDAYRGFFDSWGAPGHALKVTFDNVGAAYRVMFTGSMIDPAGFWHSLTTGKGWDNTLTPISETLTYATPLVIVSIGVGIAFQTGLFNIGGNGQAVLGGIAGAVVGSMIKLPMIIHLPLTLVAGILEARSPGRCPAY